MAAIEHNLKTLVSAGWSSRGDQVENVANTLRGLSRCSWNNMKVKAVDRCRERKVLGETTIAVRSEVDGFCRTATVVGGCFDFF